MGHGRKCGILLATLIGLTISFLGTSRLFAATPSFALGAEVARLMNARVYQVLFLSVSRSTRDAGSLGAKLSNVERMGFRKTFAAQLVRDLPKTSQIVAACANTVDESIERICKSCVEAVRGGDEEATAFLLGHLSETNVGLLADRDLRGALKPVVRRLGARIRFLKQSSENAGVRARCETLLEGLDHFEKSQLLPIKEADFQAAVLRHFASR